MKQAREVDVSGTVLELIQRGGRKVAGALGRDSAVVRALRPAYYGLVHLACW